jgi:uncharacterized protein
MWDISMLQYQFHTQLEPNPKNQLDDLLKTDPFYVAGLRQSYEILHWSKANEEPKVLI